MRDDDCCLGMIGRIQIEPKRQGLLEVADAVAESVAESGLREGLCTVFVQHTSASLLIQENADDSARVDLERWLARLVPEGDAIYTHTLEGPDDMPAHVKSALTASSLSIPILDGKLALGTWQGIFLWEHRHRPGIRCLVVHIGG